MSLLESMKIQNHRFVLSGDGRCDSPGHSAKFGWYAMIELSCNKVIDFSLVQVRFTSCNVILFIQSNEIGGSYHVEKEGLLRCLQFL